MNLPATLYDIFKNITAAEIQETKDMMLANTMAFILEKYPNIKLDRAEANMIEFVEMKKASDACRLCMGWECCPNPDLMRLTGELTAGGYIRLSHTYCPNNYKKPKLQGDETASDREAKRRGRQHDPA